MKKGTTGSLSCTVEDYKRKSATVRIQGVPIAKVTTANALKLAEFIEEHSDARVTSFGVTHDAIEGEIHAGKYDRVLQRLEFLFENGNGKSRKMSYPAPRDEDVNADQEPDSDVAEDFKDLLVSFGALSNPTYNGGGLRSRLPKKGQRATVLTGV